MTNKDKFLRDGVSIEELADKLTKKIQSTEKYGFYDNFVNDILIKFFKAKDVPTLTEDERVILRNIDLREYNVIGRDKNTKELYLAYSKFVGTDEREYIFDVIYPDLFQFIKERRRI